MAPLLAPVAAGATFVFACRRCGGEIDARVKAGLLGPAAMRSLLDCACAACGHRALYRAAA